MKVKYTGTLLLATLTFFGCDDNTGTLGMGMLPDADGIQSKTITFDVATHSVAVDSVFARTSTGYIGRFTDPEFGYYESSFLTELNCTEDFRFPEVYDRTKKTGILTGDSLPETRLVLFYSKWFGDSLNACRMSVYELNSRLEKNRYTNIKPEEYYNRFDSKSLLGRKAYSAHDASIPDSIRYGTDHSGNSTYSPHIAFTLSKEFGDKLLKLNRTHPEYFKNSDAFINHVFKGIYAKTDYGDGTILYIDQVSLQAKYHYFVLDTLKVPYKRKDLAHLKEDSTAYAWATVFASTKEVVQANQFLNSDIIKERAKETQHTYIKSPAGIFTEAILPYDAIYTQLKDDTLNAAKLTFTNYNQVNPYEFSMSAPNNVLLIRKKELKTFFEKNDLPDNITSYTVSHNNVTTNQYTFQNVARLVTACINEKNAAKKEAKAKAGVSWKETSWEETWKKENPDWDKVLLMPVTIALDNSNNQNPTMTGIQNDLRPGYAKLKGGPEGGFLKLEVTYSSFNK